MSRPADLPLEVLERARRLGFLGPGPVEAQRTHAAGFGEAAEAALGAPPATLVDLGSGGGLPGLVLAGRWPDCLVTLVESNHRRSDHLREAAIELGWGARVEVVEERAEVVAQDPRYRERFVVATARSFAEPAVTAEIAAGLVAPGGVLVVSEPPQPAPERWPADALHALGFGPARPASVPAGQFVVIRKEGPAPAEAPRGIGRPTKRPRW